MSSGSYVGACIFLIVLGIILRSLVVAKSVLERHWTDAELHSRYLLVKTSYNERDAGDSDSVKGVLTVNGFEMDVLLVRRKMEAPRPMRILVDGQRAAINTTIVGILYLKYATGSILRTNSLLTMSSMLAVMTMNLGYLLSVLGGVFLGSLVLGRYGGWTDAYLHV